MLCEMERRMLWSWHPGLGEGQKTSKDYTGLGPIPPHLDRWCIAVSVMNVKKRGLHQGRRAHPGKLVAAETSSFEFASYNSLPRRGRSWTSYTCSVQLVLYQVAFRPESCHENTWLAVSSLSVAESC